MNIYLELFMTFAKVGACTFGGGYAMLPILQRDVVERKGWATEQELTDYFAIGQCTPGIIAVNVATFVGYKYKGVPGGVCATLGLVSPSVLIISVLATLITTFIQYPVITHALAGVNACVIALIASSVLKLGKAAVVDWVTAGIFLGALAAAVIFGISPVLLVLCAGLAGYAAKRLAALRRGEEKA